MASTKFYLDFRGKAKDGRGSLLIMLFHMGRSVSIPAGVRLLQSEWNGIEVVNRPDKKEMTTLINKKKYDIDLKLMELSTREDIEEMNVKEIKERIIGKKKETETENLHSVETLFRDYMSRDMRDGTRSIYESTLKKVLTYAGGDMHIDMIDFRWITEFDTYLSRTQSINGRAIYLRALRTICNYARKLGMTEKYGFLRFRIRQEETANRNVSVEQLRKLMNADVEPWRRKYLDYFFLMFYLIGINAADLFTLRRDAVQHGRLEYVRAKTHRKYSIKIEPEAAALLHLYRGDRYLVNAMDGCSDYHNFLKEMNAALKDIGDVEWTLGDISSETGKPELVRNVTPYVPGITSYYARHSWATIAYDLGISVDVIAQALGHSMGNRVTMTYVKTDPAKVDEANRKVIDFLLAK